MVPTRSIIPQRSLVVHAGERAAFSCRASGPVHHECEMVQGQERITINMANKHI